MPSVLNPYNLDAACPKCGGKEIITRYHEDGQGYTEYLRHGYIKGEHLDRICRICGYVWAEACVGVGP